MSSSSSSDSRGNTSKFQAVLFDLGGVVLESPFIAISQYERDLDLPQHTINRHIHFAGDNGAWQKLERGELTLETFYLAFRQGARCRSRCAATHKRTHERTQTRTTIEVRGSMAAG